MAEEPDNLVLQLLRRMDQRLQATDVKLDRLIDDVDDLKVRMASVEEGLVGVHRRMDSRLDRGERRLELVDVVL